MFHPLRTKPSALVVCGSTRKRKQRRGLSHDAPDSHPRSWLQLLNQGYFKSGQTKVQGSWGPGLYLSLLVYIHICRMHGAIYTCNIFICISRLSEWCFSWICCLPKTMVFGKSNSASSLWTPRACTYKYLYMYIHMWCIHQFKYSKHNIQDTTTHSIYVHKIDQSSWIIYPCKIKIHKEHHPPRNRGAEWLDKTKQVKFLLGCRRVGGLE